MKVFKFGGASVKDAGAVRNVFNILSRYTDDDLCIVFSAMGKTTNALEKVADSWMKQDQSTNDLILTVADAHFAIARELDIETSSVEYWIDELRDVVSKTPPSNYDEGYDRVVSIGELLSTSVISAFLALNGYQHTLADARRLIITEPTYRNAKPDWDKTLENISIFYKNTFTDKEAKNRNLQSDAQLHNVIITQGFIGSSISGEPVTLGREGSDFSAAIFAWALHADEMIIWKDVPGVLNADPRYFEETIKLDRMSYRDAIELAYYGASVIHPKTIQPLQSRQIPLLVKSFYHPDEPGTLIQAFDEEIHADQIPSFIFKPDQVLVSISPRDFSFIAEDNLHSIFGLLASIGIHLNMMQHSAISFSIVMDNNPEKVQKLFEALGDDFRVKYNKGLQLITIRYYDQPTIDKVINNRRVLLEQKSRTTVQLVVSAE